MAAVAVEEVVSDPLEIGAEAFPEGFELVASVSDLRGILPYRNDKPLRLHAIGRMTVGKESHWCGLFKVTDEVTAGHFGILPGCQFSEILAQAAAAAVFYDRKWSRIIGVGMLECGMKATKASRGQKGVSLCAKTGDVVCAVIDQLWVATDPVEDEDKARVLVRARGRLFARGNQIAKAYAYGEGAARI